MSWENIKLPTITTSDCNNNNYWESYCPMNSSASGNWKSWNNNYASSLSDAHPVELTEVNTPRWLFGDESCGIQHDFTSLSSTMLFFYYNNVEVLRIPFEVTHMTQDNWEIFLYAGIDDSTEKGSVFMMMRDPSDGTAKQWYGQTFIQDYLDKLYLIFKSIPQGQSLSGGAGSGYIGNSLLSNKKMVGYNVPTSSAESTKTESVSEASETPVSGKPKIGNGFARVKFLRDWTPPAEYQELLDLINGANFTEKYYMTDNWITKLSDSATSGATASIDNGFKSYSYARYTDTGNSNIWYTNPVAQWNNNSYSNNKYVAGTSSWEGTTEPCTCGIVAFSKLNININKVSNDSYTFSLSNLSPLAVYSFYGTKYYIFRVRYNPSDSPTGWRSFSVSYTELPPEYLGSVSYTGTLENCLKVIAMNFRNVNIYVDGILWSAAVS